jgi:hypothetical protein
LETSVASESKTDNRYLGPYEVQWKNRGGAYILQELDGSVWRNGPVAAFRLLPYITRYHWFMRTGWMGPEPKDDESEDSTDSEELTDTSTGN